MEHFAYARNNDARFVRALMLGLLIVCFGSGASALQDDLKTGATYETQGQFFRAAEAYLNAVRQKPRDQKARRALERTAVRAIDEKLQDAETLAADLKTSEAIAELESAARFSEKLAELGIQPVRAREIAARRDLLIADRVQALFAEVESARAEGLWSAAIAHLQELETLRPGSDDTRDLLHDTWASWGDSNLRDGRLRAAVERYEHASRVPGARSNRAAAKAATIRVGLAESALGKGACRAAVADLRRAEQFAAGSVRPELLGQATACAATCVRLSVAADHDSGATQVTLDRLLAELRKQVAAGASEFLRVAASDPAGTPTCDRRTIPGVDGEPQKVGPYSAVVRVTSINIIRQPASSSTRQARTHQVGVETFTTYEEYRENLTGSISGWITVTDQRATVMTVPMPLRAGGQATARWQRSPVSSISRENVLTGQRDTAVMIDISRRDKPQADKERNQARHDLVDTLTRNLATQAAQRLLSTLDVEPAVADPAELSGFD